MKTEMQMLANGNYESVILPVQHDCQSKCYNWSCKQWSHAMDKLILTVEQGDPYEDGFKTEIEVKYCPFCGYKAEG